MRLVRASHAPPYLTSNEEKIFEFKRKYLNSADARDDDEKKELKKGRPALSNNELAPFEVEGLAHDFFVEGPREAQQRHPGVLARSHNLVN